MDSILSVDGTVAVLALELVIQLDESAARVLVESILPPDGTAAAAGMELMLLLVGIRADVSVEADGVVVVVLELIEFSGLDINVQENQKTNVSLCLGALPAVRFFLKNCQTEARHKKGA